MPTQPIAVTDAFLALSASRPFSWRKARWPRAACQPAEDILLMPLWACAACDAHGASTFSTLAASSRAGRRRRPCALPLRLPRESNNTKPRRHIFMYRAPRRLNAAQHGQWRRIRCQPAMRQMIPASRNFLVLYQQSALGIQRDALIFTGLSGRASTVCMPSLVIHGNWSARPCIVYFIEQARRY